MTKIILTILLLSINIIQSSEIALNTENKEEQEKSKEVDLWYNKFVKKLDFTEKYILLNSLYQQIQFIYESILDEKAEENFVDEIDELSRLPQPQIKKAAIELLEMGDAEFYSIAFEKLAKELEMQFLIEQLQKKLDAIHLFHN